MTGPHPFMDQSTPLRSTWLLAGIIAAVLMIALVASSRELYFGTAILEQGDAAVNALQIDNARHGTEIYGNYSRFQFNHPGPVLFYVYAAGEYILRDWLGVVPSPHNAHLLASLAVQVGCFALALAILQFWFDSWLFLAAALLAGMLHFAQVPGAFNSIWPPHVLLMPFLCFITAASSFAAGRTRHLAVMTVMGGILFHSHVAQPLFVGGLGGVAGLLYWRREKRNGAWPGARAWLAAHRGLLWFCGAWTALMLLPLVIDVCRYGLQSNVATILRRFLLNTTEHKSLLQSLLYFLSFPTYTTDQEYFLTQLNAASGRFFLDHLPILLTGFAGLGGPAVLAWVWRRRLPGPLRDFLGSAYTIWGATALLCLVWGLLQSGPMFQFNGDFYHAAYYFLAMLGVGGLVHFFGRRCPAPVIVVLCCLATIVASWSFRLIPGPNEDEGQRIRQGVETALARSPRHRPVLLVFEHHAWDVAAIPVALELQRRGIPFYASPSWNFMVGRQHDVGLLGPAPEKSATVWWITRAAPDGILIAKDLAIFTDPAPIDPHGAVIGFAKSANGYRHLVSGLSTGNVTHAWTDQPQVSLLFRPLPATADVQLILDAQSNPRPGASAPQAAEVFFNGVDLGPVSVAERRHVSLTVPKDVWNAAPVAKLELRFPEAVRVYLFTKPASISWAAWGLWGVWFASAADPVPAQPTALLPAAGGRIDFTAGGSLAGYRTSGFAEPAAGATHTDGGLMDLLFRPGPATADVELQIVAQPFSADGKTKTLPCEVYFNDKLVFNSPFNGPGVIRLSIPAVIWNSRPVDTLSLRLPSVPATNGGGHPDDGLALRWLTTAPAERRP